VTPKQPQRSAFNRQITNFEIPASFYYDPHDESTHTLEYASAKSGHDYNANPSFMGKEISLPATASGSSTERDADRDVDDHGGDTDVEADVSAPAAIAEVEFVKPPPRFGKLVSTSDSFTPITLNLTNRITSWGRMTTNTHVYPDKNETRVPKVAVEIRFYARDIENLPEGGDWTKLPGLFCTVSTESSVGLWVNGVQLKKGDAGKVRPWGRIYTGDEITVAKPSPQHRLGLKFKCEFFHGEGKEKRPEGKRFVVETARADDPKPRTKGKEKEVVDATEKVAG